MTDPAAEVIADDLLYMTGRAIHRGNFDHFKVHLLLPQIMETVNQTFIMRTEEELREMFQRVRAQMREAGIKQFIRTVVSSEFLDSDTVGSTHVSKAIKADGSPVGAPYPTYSVICRRPDGWKIARTCVVLLQDQPLDYTLTPFE